MAGILSARGGGCGFVFPKGLKGEGPFRGRYVHREAHRLEQVRRDFDGRTKGTNPGGTYPAGHMCRHASGELALATSFIVLMKRSSSNTLDEGLVRSWSSKTLAGEPRRVLGFL